MFQDFLDVISDMFNITFTCNKDPLNDWGTGPKTGTWFDKNATFSGVLGRVINGEYDVSVSAWLRNVERSLWLDYHIRFNVARFQYLIKFIHDFTIVLSIDQRL